MEDRPTTNDPRGERQLNRVTRGLAGLGVLGAIGLAILGIVLMGFAQVIPAIFAFGFAAAVALFSVPVFWAKMPHDRDAYERRLR